MKRIDKTFDVRQWMGRMLTVCAAFACLQSHVQAYPGLQESKYITTFDVATYFRGDYDLTYVQAYCHISTMNLQFIKTKTAFLALFQTTMTVTDEQQNKVFEQSLVDTVTVETFRDIDALRPARVLCFTMELEPGSYTFEMQVQDLDTNRDFRLKKTIDIEDYYRSETTISTISLAADIKRAAGNSPLVKSVYEVHPNVCRVFRPDVDSLFVYAEIYRPWSHTEHGDTFRIVCSIVDEDSNVVWERGSDATGLDTSLSVMTGLDVSEFGPGYYDLVLQVDFPHHGYRLKNTSSFIVLRPDLEAEQYARLIRMRFDEQESY